MRDVYREIQENLDQIERKYDVRILLAVESGSRAWGFASPDSDYDVRFIYKQKARDYLRIDPAKDVIEWQLDEVLDINGWDLKKAMYAMGKGNPNLLEWTASPIVYRKAPEWEEIAALKGSCFSKKAALHHYYGIAGHTLKEYLTGDKVKYKKYFYALRPLLCCRWIRRFHEAPPVEFSRLLTLFEMGEEDLTPALYGAIEKLLAKKAVTEERDLNPQMPEIIGFIEAECKRQKALLAETKDDRKRDMQDLNECFFSLLKEEL
jgi:predicted nucleotidyltransferase